MIELNIGILASEGSWYFKDLERAGRDLGLSCVRLDFERLISSVGTGVEIVECRSYDPASISGPSPRLDLVIVRTMPPGSLEQVVYRMDALARLQHGETRVVNSPKSLECAVDKYLTTARLQAGGLPVPDTIVCEHEDDAMDAFERLGGDVVVKPLFGAEGRGIVRVSDPDMAHRTFRTLMRLNSVLYLQRFIDHAGYDVRVMVLGGQVLGGMKRFSPNDFRTNVARQAIAESHLPTTDEMELSLKAAAITGADIAGIDLLYDRDGRCFVIEVNAVPGWMAFGRANKIDVSARFLRYLMG